MSKQGLVLVEQAHPRTHYTQLPPPLPPRGHPPQQRHGPRSVPHQQFDGQTHHHHQSQDKQGKQARPGVEVLHVGLGKPQLPLGIAKALLPAKPPGVLRRGRVSAAGSIGDQVPDLPLALSVPRAAHRDPQAVGGTFTGGQVAQVALAGGTHKPQGVELAPVALEADFGAALAPDNKLHAQLGQDLHQGHIGKATVGRNEHAPAAKLRLHPGYHAADAGPLRAPHPPLQDRGRVGPPIDRPGPATRDQRAHQQMLGAFNGLIQGQPPFPFRGQLAQRLRQHCVGHAVGGQARVMPQARQPFEGRLGLIARLFLNDRAHKGCAPFELVAMCPGEDIRAILLEASRPRVLGCHKPRLARVRTRGYSPPNECVLTSVLTQCLAGTPYLVSEAATGLEGLHCAREEQPQIIFLDLMMPGGDGYAALATQAAALLAKDALSRESVAAVLTDVLRAQSSSVAKEERRR